MRRIRCTCPVCHKVKGCVRWGGPCIDCAEEGDGEKESAGD
jgi:hypothetical protein